MKIGFRLLAAVVVAGTTGLVMIHIAIAQQAAPSNTPLADPSPLQNRSLREPNSLQNTFSGWSPTQADPVAGNPEAAKLYAAEVEAARDAQSLVSQLPQASSEELRGDLKAKLRDALVRQFDAQQKRRSLEITSIEERLAKFRDTLKKRDAAKDTIITKRLDQLTGVGDDLDWEETKPFGPGSVIYPQLPYSTRSRPAPSLPEQFVPAPPPTPRR